MTCLRPMVLFLKCFSLREIEKMFSHSEFLLCDAAGGRAAQEGALVRLQDCENVKVGGGRPNGEFLCVCVRMHD